MVDEQISTWLMASWVPISTASLSPYLAEWLTDHASMTKRLEQYCNKLTVTPTCEGWIIPAQSELPLLPAANRYWLREVILSGDQHPWVLARTVIPEETCCAREGVFQALGAVSLGHYLFSQPELRRDCMQVTHNGVLWGRRSRFLLADAPLLVTEIFLPDSPLYA